MMIDKFKKVISLYLRKRIHFSECTIFYSITFCLEWTKFFFFRYCGNIFLYQSGFVHFWIFRFLCRTRAPSQCTTTYFGWLRERFDCNFMALKKFLANTAKTVLTGDNAYLLFRKSGFCFPFFNQSILKKKDMS